MYAKLGQNMGITPMGSKKAIVSSSGFFGSNSRLAGGNTPSSINRGSFGGVNQLPFSKKMSMRQSNLVMSATQTKFETQNLVIDDDELNKQRAQLTKAMPEY